MATTSNSNIYIKVYENLSKDKFKHEENIQLIDPRCLSKDIQDHLVEHNNDSILVGTYYDVKDNSLYVHFTSKNCSNNTMLVIC